MIKKSCIGILLFVFIFAFVGCYGESSQSGAEMQQVLRITAGNEIPTMDSTGTLDVLSQSVINNVFEGLYRFGKDSKPIPGIARSHEVSQDGKTYTFHLRKAKWSNGTPVTAHDFIYAWKKSLHPDSLSIYAYLFDDIKNAAAIQDKSSSLYGNVDKLGVKAIDDYTLEVKLEKPVPYFLSLVSFPSFFPQNEEFVDSQGDQYGLETEHLIFNGPFILDNWKHEEGWELKKNPDYWDADTVKLDKVKVKVVKDTSTAVNLYESNDIDIVNLSAEFVDSYQDSPEYSTMVKPEVYFIRMNQKNEFLKNRHIRKAIDLGWDKKELTEQILNNGSLPAYYLVPKDFVTGPDGRDFRSEYSDFNTGGVKEAKKHWEKGLKELGVNQVELELLSYDDELSKTVTSYIRNQLETNLPGLSLRINRQPNKQKIVLESKMDYELSYSGWNPDFQDPITFVDLFVSDGPYNWSDYKNPEADRLVYAAKSESDAKERWSLLQEAERIFIEEDAVISPMFQTGQARLMKPYVKGYVSHPLAVSASYKWTYME
ncbi:peptide ABC transporter substrate-binding protein [Desmospora profundinema]|uniref:Oligopeptide transport system substrate-binding protein n=1 Tax=Desmospora profundinema TaxID=1571184 RepID=A0ABU1IJG8_9BACL|nr:peptide ABC transporter substrate-binding protein [Desmospora profundinema]MDR6224906.1 oligopeptide transport system substrate-binding protein [Desmospora profundinema]